MFAAHGWSVHVAELRVAVARIVRRHGLGSALAGLLVEMAIDEGADKLVVQVVEHQVAALQVFRKLGFQPEALLRRHVKDLAGRVATCSSWPTTCRTPGSRWKP